MPRDWSKWNSPDQAVTSPQSARSQVEEDGNENTPDLQPHSKEILDGPEDCEKLFSSGSGSRSSFTSVDSGFFSCEEDFREKVESLNAEKLKAWIRSVSNSRNSFSEKPLEICQPLDGEILDKVCPYGNIEDYGRYEWDGSLDSEGKLHGRGFLSFPDGGSMLGVWQHGVR